MTQRIVAHVDYRVAAGGEIDISLDELRERGVALEDYDAVEKAIHAFVREQLYNGGFDPFRDWTDYHRDDLEILDVAVDSFDIAWDDLTEAERARVPLRERP